MAALCYVFTSDGWFMDFAFMPVGGVDISSVQRFNFFFSFSCRGGVDISSGASIYFFSFMCKMAQNSIFEI